MAKTYEAIIAIVDKYSAPILKMEEKLRHLGAAGEAANKMMTPHQHLFANLSQDLTGISEKFGKVREGIGDMGAKIGELVGPLAAFGAAGSLAGLVEMTHSFAEATEQLGIGAKIAGTTVQAMQILDYAAKQTGVATDSLQHSMGLLNKNLAMAAAGKDKNLASLMGHLHISMRGVNGQILSGVQLLPKLADAFAKTTDPAMAALMAQELFGRSGMDMIPLLDKGAAGLADYTAAFQKYGYVLSNQDVAAGEAFNESWKNMQAAIGGLTDDISAKLAPVLTPIINQIADWTAKNRDWIASGLHDALVSVSTTLQQIDFKAVLEGMKTFGEDTWNVVNAVGGLKTLLVGGALVMFAPFAAAIVTTTEAVWALGYSMGAPIVAALWGLGATMVAVIPMIDSLSAAMAAFDLVLDANPIGAIIVAIGLMGAAAYELYKHWDAVSKLLRGPWGAIVADFGVIMTPLGGWVIALGADAMQLYQNWDIVSKDLSATWKWIKSEFDAVFGPIGTAMDKLNADLQALENFGDGAPAPAGTRVIKTRFGTMDLPPAPGHTTIDVNFNNPPAGASITSKSTGNTPMPKISTGRSSMAGS